MSETAKVMYDIVQPLTRDPMQAKEGQFLNKTTGAGLDELVIEEIHAAHQTRVKFTGDNGLECFSHEGEMPDAEEPLAEACGKDCPGCSKDLPKKERCARKYVIDGLHDDGIPFRLRLAPSGRDVCKQVNELATLYGGHGPVGVTLGIRQKIDSKGKYYVPEVRKTDIKKPAKPAEPNDDVPF